MNYKQAAIKVLEEARKPLHYREIALLASEKGYIKSEGRTPWATINALLSTDIAKHKENSFFVKSAPGCYMINPNKKLKRRFGIKVRSTSFEYNTNGSIKREIEREKLFTISPTLNSKQKGDIAEARVVELITLYGNVGLSCYRPVSDDEGIDIIVKRRERLDVVYIQVKSTFGSPPNRGFVSAVKESTIKDKARMLFVFVFFDLTSGDLFDNIFCIPAPEFLQLTKNDKRQNDKRIFTVSLTHPDKSKYAEYMIEKRELATRIVEIMDKL